MMPVVMIFFSLFTYLYSLHGGAIDATQKRIRESVEQQFQYEAKAAQQALVYFYERNHRLPSNLEELIMSEGNEYLRTIRPSRLDFASATINSNVLSYSKGMIWHNRANPNTQDSITSNNQSGGTSFFEDGEYVPPASVYWFQIREDDEFRQLQQFYFTSLDETASRLLKSASIVPVNTHNSTLKAGDSLLLAQAVGFTGSQETCRGVFSFDGAPVTCSDLFSFDGIPVRYELVSENEALLSIQSTSLKDASGNPLEFITQLSEEDS